MPDRLVAVTGATGFVGHACATALAAQGFRLRLLVRADPARPLLPGTDAELVRGDLADRAALARLVRGADAVVHAAGATRALTAAAFLATNRDGTANVAAATDPAVPLVLLSSQAARAPHVSAYAASKRAGEDAATEIRPCAILRPGIIYGPHDAATDAVLRLAAAPLVPVPRPEPQLAILHIADVAALVARLCAAPAAACLYEMADNQAGHPWRAILAAAAARPPRFLPLPDPVFAAVGALAQAWGRITRTPGLFGPGKAAEIRHRDWRPDPALLPPPTLWQPTVQLAAGFAALRPLP